MTTTLPPLKVWFTLQAWRNDYALDVSEIEVDVTPLVLHVEPADRAALFDPNDFGETLYQLASEAGLIDHAGPFTADCQTIEDYFEAHEDAILAAPRAPITAAPLSEHPVARRIAADFDMVAAPMTVEILLDVINHLPADARTSLLDRLTQGARP